MQKKNMQRIGQAAAIALGAYLMVGGPLQSASNWLANESDTREAVAQEAGDRTAVEFETCAAVADWQRPSAHEQSKHLEKTPHFDTATGSDDAKATSSPFWHQQIVSFTTYGLSARLEPLTLTGLWTVDAQMQNCYTPETTMALDAGDRAETWLLNYRVESLEKEGDRYAMTVEPTATGMQVVQFERDDELAALPLDVVDTNGETVEVASGDWQ